MPRVEIFRLKGLAVVLLLACSLLATGFAHRVPGVAQAAFQAYVLAGGGAADLCIAGTGTGGDRHGHDQCPVCHLTGSAVLPDATPGIRDADLTFLAHVVQPCESRALRMVRDPARGLRAPPLA